MSALRRYEALVEHDALVGGRTPAESWESIACDLALEAANAPRVFASKLADRADDCRARARRARTIAALRATAN